MLEVIVCWLAELQKREDGRSVLGLCLDDVKQLLQILVDLGDVGCEGVITFCSGRVFAKAKGVWQLGQYGVCGERVCLGGEVSSEDQYVGVVSAEMYFLTAVLSRDKIDPVPVRS